MTHWISTSVPEVDRATGGGVPRGRVTELLGLAGTGKRTLALLTAAFCQRQGGTVMWIDCDHAFSIERVEACGVDAARLLVRQPDEGAQALDVLDRAVRSGAVQLVVADSLWLLTLGDRDPEAPVSPLLVSRALRRVVPAAHRAGTAVLWISQSRLDAFGRPRHDAGQQAVKFYASLRIDCRRPGYCRVIKNKLAAPFMEAEYDLTARVARQEVTP